MSMFGSFLSMTCPACGASIGDWDLHQDWHASLAEITRKVLAPDMTMEDFQALAQREFNGQAAVREAKRAVEDAEARQRIEERDAKRQAERVGKKDGEA